jgi:ABC-type transporter Mla subunit MlaD
MKHLHQFLLVAVVVMLAAPAAALGAQTPARITEGEIKDLLKKIDTDTEHFRKTVNKALDKSALNKTTTEDNINRYIKDLEHYTDALKHNWSDSNTATGTVQEVLARGSNIEGFVQKHQLKEPVTTDWGVLRVDLDHLAALYGVKWGPTGVAGNPYRVSEDEVKGLLSRLDQNSENFRTNLNESLDKSSLNKTGTENDYNRFAKEFAEATDKLKSNYGDKDLAPGSVSEVLRRAKVINETMKKYPQATKAQSDWALVRADLDTLAKYYSVNWRW